MQRTRLDGFGHVAILGSRGFPSTYGGYETLVRYLARAWVSQGLDVTVYCRAREEGLRTWTNEGVTCRWTPGRETKSLSTLSYGLTSHLDASRRKFDAALILNVANGFFLPAMRAAGTATVVNTDGIEWERGKWGTIARKVFLAGAWATARFADALVADSRAIAEIWAEKFGVRSTYIPYGAPVLRDVDATLVEGLNVEPGKYALIVARLIPENNVDLLLDALDIVSPRIPAVVAGSSNGTSQVEARLRELDSKGQVRWLGHVSDQALLAQLWAHCGVYLHGHSVGGTNPALLQALGAGAPTLALATPFNREVIGQEAQLFPADASRLAEMISAVLRDPGLRRSMGDGGRCIVAERYEWPTVANLYLDALVSAYEQRTH